MVNKNDIQKFVIMGNGRWVFGQLNDSEGVKPEGSNNLFWKFNVPVILVSKYETNPRDIKYKGFTSKVPAGDYVTRNKFGVLSWVSREAFAEEFPAAAGVVVAVPASQDLSNKDITNLKVTTDFPKTSKTTTRTGSNIATPAPASSPPPPPRTGGGGY